MSSGPCLCLRSVWAFLCDTILSIWSLYQSRPHSRVCFFCSLQTHVVQHSALWTCHCDFVVFVRLHKFSFCRLHSCTLVFLQCDNCLRLVQCRKSDSLSLVNHCWSRTSLLVSSVFIKHSYSSDNLFGLIESPKSSFQSEVIINNTSLISITMSLK